MTTHRVDNILAAVSAHPWAITRQKLDQIREFLAFRADGGVVAADEVAALRSARPSRPGGQRGAVAILPIHGTITLRSVPMSDVGTTVLAVNQALDQALADPSVETILLEIDSPGGTVDGVPELAAKIRAARSRKRVVAIANTMAASAAYWIATAADELIVSPSGVVGSVGVYMLHVDFSEQNKKRGVSPTYISFGEHKVDGNFDSPLPDEVRQHFQSEVNKVGEAFVADVARHMGVSTAAVRQTFGGGYVVQAKDAVARGMAHRLATFDETLERLVSRGAPPARASFAAAPSRIGRNADVERRRLALQDDTSPRPAGRNAAIERLKLDLED